MTGRDWCRVLPTARDLSLAVAIRTPGGVTRTTGVLRRALESEAGALTLWIEIPRGAHADAPAGSHPYRLSDVSLGRRAPEAAVRFLVACRQHGPEIELAEIHPRQCACGHRTDGAGPPAVGATAWCVACGMRLGCPSRARRCTETDHAALTTPRCGACGAPRPADEPRLARFALID